MLFFIIIIIFLLTFVVFSIYRLVVIDVVCSEKTLNFTKMYLFKKNIFLVNKYVFNY